MSDIEKKVKKMYDAMNCIGKQRLGKVKKACKKIIFSIPNFKNPKAKEIVKKILDEANKDHHWVEIAQYTLFNIYFGFERKVNPMSKVFKDFTNTVINAYRSTNSDSVRGVLLGSLLNLGPMAINLWKTSITPDPLFMALKSQNPFLRKCATEALSELNVQKQGKPMLASKELATVRQMGHDVPAYQESVHYTIGYDGDQDIKDAGVKVKGQVVDSKVVGQDEDGAQITKQTILIPGKNS